MIRTYEKVYLGFSKGSHCRTETVTRISDDESGSDATGADELVSASTSPTGTSLTKILYCVPPDAWNGFQVNLIGNFCIIFLSIHTKQTHTQPHTHTLSLSLCLSLSIYFYLFSFLFIAVSEMVCILLTMIYVAYILVYQNFSWALEHV